MMKVLIVETGTTGYGGSFKSAYLTAKLLKEAGHQPEILYANPSPYWVEAEKHGIPLHHCPDPYRSEKEAPNRRRMFRAKLKIQSAVPSRFASLERLFRGRVVNCLERVVTAGSFEIIHLNHTISRDIFALCTKRPIDGAVVSHLRANPKRPVSPGEHKLLEKRAPTFIAVSKFVADRWRQAGLDGMPVEVLHNVDPGLKDANPSENMKPPADQQKDTVQVLFAGRVEQGKGVDVLIDALAQIRGLSWNASIAGSGSKFQELVGRVAELGIEERVSFLGYHDDLASVYQRSHILVVPSKHEAFGRTVIEGMAHGLAVIGTRAGGIPELIDHNRTGILVPYGDAHTLATALSNLIKNRTERHRLGAAARTEALARFTGEHYLKRLEDIYRLALSRRSSLRPPL